MRVMRIHISLLAFLGFSCCIAQTNPMEYFYKGKEVFPDFAALAVLESQHCPNPIDFSKYPVPFSEHRGIGEDKICTSRYRIIRVLDAASDTLKKEYIEAKEMPVISGYMHMPTLIFGEYRNGAIQITNYEFSSSYFSDEDAYSCVQNRNFSPFVDYDGIWALRSVGTPYFNIKNSNSIDTIFYNEYLGPRVKRSVEAAGKNFGELLLRLIHNREPIRAAPIKNEFAALGAIKSIRQAKGPKQANLYELNVAIETIIKNDAKMGPNIAIFIDRGRLPSGWGCQPFDYYLNNKIAFYFLGDLKDGSLFIDSLVSPQDAFVFGDTIYDISMGLPYEELIAYFFPPNISLEEFKFGQTFGQIWKNEFPSIRSGEFPGYMKDMPECQRKAFVEIAAKQGDFLGNRPPKEKIGKWEEPFISNFYGAFMLSIFSCRESYSGNPCLLNGPPGCRKPYFKDECEVWGSISIKNKKGTGKIKTDKFKIGNKIKSRRGDLWLKYAAGDVRTTACKVRFGEEMTIVEELEYYVLVKASCGQGWLGKADVEEFSAVPYDPYDRFRRFESGEIFAPGPCMPL